MFLKLVNTIKPATNLNDMKNLHLKSSRYNIKNDMKMKEFFLPNFN